MYKYIVFALASLSTVAFAQVSTPAVIPAPQINLTGNIGCQGFSCLNNGTLTMATDADRPMTALETSAVGGIRVVSTTSLTATRNLILPAGNFQFLAIRNATSGGQALGVCSMSASGPCLASPIPNGTSATIWFDGTSVNQTGLASSTGCGAYCFVTNPTTVQTVNVTAGGQTQFFGTNCLDNFGLGYGVAGCLNNTATYNTFAPRNNNGAGNQSLQFNYLTAYGAGVDLGGISKWRTVKIFNNTLYDYTRGIGQGAGSTVECLKVGDCAGGYTYARCSGGSTAPNDEGCTAAGFYDGEQDQNSSFGYFHGTVSTTTGTGDTAPVLAYTSGESFVGDGGILLDISKGTISGTLNGTSVAMTPAYLNYLPVTGVTLPVTGAWGLVNAPTSWAGVPANVATNTTVTVTLQTIGGSTPSFPSSGYVCIAGYAPPENAAFTSTAATGTTQTLTIALRNYHSINDSVFYGGTCGQYLSMDQDVTFAGIRSSYIALGSLTGTDLIYGFLIGGSIGALLPQGGLSAETGTGGFHLYPGAEIVENTNGGFQLQVEANGVAWAAGDLVENPHPMAHESRGISVQVVQTTPTNAGQQGEAVLVNMGGTGINSAFTGLRMVNNNAASLYVAGGGPLNPPPAISATGNFGSLFAVNNYPAAFFAQTGPGTPQNTYTQMVGYLMGYSYVKATLTNCALTTAGTLTLTGTFPVGNGYTYSAGQPFGINGFAGACAALNGVIGTPNYLAPPLITSVTATTLVGAVGPMTVSATVTAGSMAWVVGGTNYPAGIGPGMVLNNCTGTGAIPTGTTTTSTGISNAATTSGSIACTFSINSSADSGTAHAGGIILGSQFMGTGTGSYGTQSLFASNIEAAAIEVGGVPTCTTIIPCAVAVPATSSAACTPGQYAVNTSYHYDCVATNTWERVALSTF